MKVLFCCSEGLDTTNLTPSTLGVDVVEGECIAFNDLLPLARIAGQRELHSFKITLINSFEDSILLHTHVSQPETPMPAGSSLI